MPPSQQWNVPTIPRTPWSHATRRYRHSAGNALPSLLHCADFNLSFNPLSQAKLCPCSPETPPLWTLWTSVRLLPPVLNQAGASRRVRDRVLLLFVADAHHCSWPRADTQSSVIIFLSEYALESLRFRCFSKGLANHFHRVLRIFFFFLNFQVLVMCVLQACGCPWLGRHFRQWLNDKKGLFIK